MFRAVEHARADHWGHVEELLAQQTEILHAIVRVLVAANTTKDRRPQIPAYHYPRPGEGDGKERVSWGQLAGMMIRG